MTPRSFRVIVAGAALATYSAGAPTAPVSAQAVLRQEGRTVEVVGLRRWSLAMLQDSLARHGESLYSHTCAATLRYKLGFPEAAATRIVLSPDSVVIIISVVEPQDSARVRHRELPFDTAVRPGWESVAAVAQQEPGAFQLAVASYDPHGRAEMASWIVEHLGADTTLVKAVWHFLSGRKDNRYFEEAVRTVLGDPGIYNRMIAVAILANFTERDQAWWVLAEALRERDGGAKAIASTVLQARAQADPRSVDWAPAAPTIHALLNGTALFELPSTLQWLPRMSDGPRWSAEFLAGGADMVLAYLGTRHAPSRELAHRLLVHFRGGDLGPSPEPWREWIASGARPVCSAGC